MNKNRLSPADAERNPSVNGSGATRRPGDARPGKAGFSPAAEARNAPRPSEPLQIPGDESLETTPPPDQSASPEHGRYGAGEAQPSVNAGVQRTLSPTIVLSLGGTGNAISSCLKGILRSQRTSSHLRFVAVDTDEHAQTGVGGNPGFTDDEFVHVAVDRIRNVIDHPQDHQMLNDRHGLKESGQTAFFQRLTAQGISQGGQVRPYGNLAFLAGCCNAQLGA
jgi:Tubulin like